MNGIRRPVGAVAVAVAGLAAFLAGVPVSSAATAPAGRFVTLAGSVLPTGNARTGTYHSSLMSVEVVLAPRNAAGLAAGLVAAYGRRSRDYHRWLRPGEFGARYAMYCTGSSHTPNSLCARVPVVHGWFPVGGTSLSSPLWAGIAADLSSFTGHRIGNLNPLIYLLFNLDAPRYFHDPEDGGTHRPQPAGAGQTASLGSP